MEKMMANTDNCMTFSSEAIFISTINEGPLQEAFAFINGSAFTAQIKNCIRL